MVVAVVWGLSRGGELKMFQVVQGGRGNQKVDKQFGPISDFSI